MGNLATKIDQKYNYKDYSSWNDGERWEIIDGNAYNMSPVPLRNHQDAVGEIFWQIKNFLKDQKKHKCSAYIAPFDVRLPKSNEDKNSTSNVVQPDISIICDKKKLDDKGCFGTPDVIIEVLSPGTAQYDQTIKLELYEKSGVKELWFVHPIDKIIYVRYLKKNEYGKTFIYTENEVIDIKSIKGLQIDLSEVFTNE